LVNAIKELSAELDALKERVAALEFKSWQLISKAI
jgi:polyhydroxyalkanoate synthesis regulator phasin